MKVTSQMLSIPPYISTSWKNIVSLHTIEDSRGHILVVTLSSGSLIEVPHLAEDALKQIFFMHTKSTEQDISTFQQSASKALASLPELFPSSNSGNSLTFGFPLNLSNSEAGFGSMMQHDQDLADSPIIPDEILNKLKTITQSIGLQDQFATMPKAEPNCNCPYCQLAKVFHAEEPVKQEVIAEAEVIVSDDELKFREWDIKQVNEKLYDVTNPFDSCEHYQVHLGNPIGCTCGHQKCEHIKAVLSS